MHKVLIVVIALLALQLCNAQTPCSAAPATPQDRRTDKTKLVIATFNLAWLFDGVNDPSAPWTTPALAQSHITKVAAQILRTGADILSVQEVESCDVLAQLVAQLPGYKGYLVPGTDTATGQNAALITKIDPSSDLVRFSTRANIPVPGSTCGVATASDTGVSKHFVTTFRTSKFSSLTLVGLHLKSGGTSSDCYQREGQAQVLRTLFTTGNDVIVLGDYNDWNTLYVDAKSNTGTSKTLPIASGTDLTDVCEQLAVADRWSSGVGLIDHILVSSRVRAQFQSIMTDRSGYPTTSAELIAAGYSDHYPVVMTLRDGASSILVASTVFVVAAVVALI